MFCETIPTGLDDFAADRGLAQFDALFKSQSRGLDFGDDLIGGAEDGVDFAHLREAGILRGLDLQLGFGTRLDGRFGALAKS